LQKLALFCVKNANIFTKFFGENILKIVTSVPDGNCTKPSVFSATKCATKDHRPEKSSTESSSTDDMIFKNIFAEKFSEKIGVFDPKQGQILKKMIITIGI
jgi:hypothetical protein